MKQYLWNNHIFFYQAAKAEADCSTALDLEPQNLKALFRRAQARKVTLLCDLDQHF